MLKKFICISIFLAGLFGYSKNVTITILATTDTHGNLTSYDYLKQEELSYGFLQASDLIKKIKKDKENVVLVDCGDTLQGSPLIDYYKSSIETEPNPVIEVMNYLNYDVAVPGNHDFDFGKIFLEKAVTDSKFKWISSNIYTSPTEHYINSYAILERAGLRIGFFGLTTPFTKDSQPPKNVEGLIFKDLTESAAKVVNDLQNEKVDLIVGLVHSGLGEENSKGNMLENACSQIAENVKGIDVLLYGHTHKEMSYKTVGETLLCQPGDHLKSMGVVIVDFQQRDGKWEILSKSSTLLNLDGEKGDKKLAKLVKYASKGVEKYLDTKIGKFPYDIEFSDTPFNPGNGFLSYYQAISTFAKPDVLMLPIPTPNEKPINSKDVSKLRDIYKLAEYNNYLVQFQLKGEELKSLIEFTTAMLNTDGTIKSYYPLYNCDSFYNCKMNVDLTKEYGDRVTITSINGKPFNPGDLYSVVTTTYRYGGGGSYFMGEKPKAIKYSDKTLREILLSIAVNDKAESSNEELF